MSRLFEGVQRRQARLQETLHGAHRRETLCMLSLRLQKQSEVHSQEAFLSETPTASRRKCRISKLIPQNRRIRQHIFRYREIDIQLSKYFILATQISVKFSL